MADNNSSAVPEPGVPVISVARTLKSSDPQTLSTGIRAHIKPVSATLIDAVTSKIKDPQVPVIFMEEKGREIANPDDPEYQAALNEASRLRGLAALDALIMFGVELLDPIPAPFEVVNGHEKPADWYKKLVFMEKQGLIDLSGYDVHDEDMAEYVYKRFIAVSPADIESLNRMNRVDPEDYARAERSFRR